MVIVTVTGEPFKRYVVVEEDEHLFETNDPLTDWFYFGAQAVRRNGIDEQYRSLSSNCVVSVKRKA